MRVGIYNRWLHTIGGGEKHMCALAEVLSQDHDVEILTYQPVNKDKLQSQLSIDLSNIEIKYIPEESNELTSNITAEYDLFINASYMSSLPSKAKESCLLVYFPTPFDVELTHVQKAAIRLFSPMIKKILVNDVEWLDGFYQQERFHGIPYRWTGARARFKISKPKRESAGLQICLGSYRKSIFPQAEVSFFVNGISIGQKLRLPRDRFIVHKMKLPSGLEKGNGFTIEIQSNTFIPSEDGDSQDTRELGVSTAWVRWSGSPRFYLRRLVDLVPMYLKVFPKTLDFLETYDHILANSMYTQRWIKKLWDRDSSVLYPPVDTDEFSPGPKSNKILSVGRFFRGSHNKKQIPMIQIFKKICDEGLRGWEYHLAGGTHRESIHQNYLAEVIEESKGYPIYIHPDCSHTELKKLYGESKIYWHAAGFGENQNRNPERFEHFGITTVEAMSSGCVPIVIGRAGQVEIVNTGENGFLWGTLGQLRDSTLQVIRDEQLKQDLSLAAIKSAESFSFDRFKHRVKELING